MADVAHAVRRRARTPVQLTTSAYSYSARLVCQWKINQRKVGVSWVTDEQLVQKVWRYDEKEVAEYIRDRVEQELLALYPPQGFTARNQLRRVAGWEGVD